MRAAEPQKLPSAEDGSGMRRFFREAVDISRQGGAFLALRQRTPRVKGLYFLL